MDTLRSVSTLPPRTLADIREHGEDIGVSQWANESGTFWVIATVRNERTQYQMSGEYDDPDAVIVEATPTRFLA